MIVGFYTDETITGHIFLEPSIWVAKRYRRIFSPLEETDSKIEIIHRIGLFLILPILGILSALFIPVGLIVKGTSRFFWPPPPNVRLSQTSDSETQEGESVESPKNERPQEDEVVEKSPPDESSPPLSSTLGGSVSDESIPLSPTEEELHVSDLKDELSIDDLKTTTSRASSTFGSPTLNQSQTDETSSQVSEDSFHSAIDTLDSRRSSAGYATPEEESLPSGSYSSSIFETSPSLR